MAISAALAIIVAPSNFPSTAMSNFLEMAYWLPYKNMELGNNLLRSDLTCSPPKVALRPVTF